jgi:hypothetical protein
MIASVLELHCCFMQSFVCGTCLHAGAQCYAGGLSMVYVLCDACRAPRSPTGKTPSLG